MASLQDRIKTLWGEITASTHRFLELIAELDRTEAWAGAGLKSCAQWLNLHCGIGEVAAREKLRVAHAIKALPAIDAAFREGRLSYSKVRAMTRVATPENEDILLNIALHGTASHVERTVRYFRRVERLEEAVLAAETHRHRRVEIRYDEDDSMIVHAHLPPEIGALVLKALDCAAALAGAETANEPDEPDYAFDGPGRRRADGLRLMADRFLKVAEQSSSTSADRYQVVVHIDQALLADGGNSTGEKAEVAGAAVCELESGRVLAVETARRLACDGALVGLTQDADGHPLDIGRKTRAIPIAMQRALKTRDGGCRFPGCTHTRFTEGHHIEHWADGGETKLENLVTLCHFHHHLVHEAGYGVRRTDAGRFEFTRPDGSSLPDFIRVERCFRGNNLAESNRERGIDIDSSTIASKWTGERMDYSLAIEGMLAARERAQVETAEISR